MNSIWLIIFFVMLGVLIYYFLRKRKPLPTPDDDTIKEILQNHVLFYQRLNEEEKLRFENCIHRFLQKTKITGIRTSVDDIDSVFIAAAAIIPIFAFKGWEYNNINEVLLYPGSFTKDFQIEGTGRDTLGMVGNGPMQNVMILSKPDLRSGFLDTMGTSNTAIHEFVHLIDKTDGYTDGLPEVLLHHSATLPWLHRMHAEIERIVSGNSDINPYGTSNEAEFLAVAAEYFFKQPDQMQKKHPDLYKLLEQMFLHT